jgi:hypothetical protein
VTSATFPSRRPVTGRPARLLRFAPRADTSMSDLVRQFYPSVDSLVE